MQGWIIHEAGETKAPGLGPSTMKIYKVELGHFGPGSF